MQLKLKHPYLGHAAGEIITVSAIRGRLWIEHGIGDEVETGAETASIAPVETAMKPRAKPKTARSKRGSR